MRLAPGIEEAVQLRERWSHKAQGTPETHDHFARAAQREGSMARLVATGAIDAHQLAAAQEIATAHEAIVADVAVRTAKLEPRGTGGGPLAASAGPIAAVIRERAYTDWRAAVGPHATMLLAIIVDDMALTHAARRWRLSNRRARAILISSLDRWRRC
jgi:3-oxoacyl-ACP reductase-like protein